jgi:hypothetical protein
MAVVVRRESEGFLVRCYKQKVALMMLFAVSLSACISSRHCMLWHVSRLTTSPA